MCKERLRLVYLAEVSKGFSELIHSLKRTADEIFQNMVATKSLISKLNRIILKFRKKRPFFKHPSILSKIFLGFYDTSVKFMCKHKLKNDY